MNTPKTKKDQFSRRDFLGKCISGGALTFGLGILGNSRSGLANPETAASYKYEPVANWPQLPEGFAFDNVTGIHTDAAGKVYASGSKEYGISVFDPNGKYLTSWGKGIIKNKHEIRIYGDVAWVADLDNHQVHEFTLDGKLIRSLGTKGEYGTDETHFKRPSDIAIASNGDIYVSDGYGNSRVVCFAGDGTFKRTWGTKGAEPGQFDKPHNIAIDAKDLIYVADRSNYRIQIFDLAGKFIKQFKNVGKPFGLYITADQKLFVADGEGNRILIMDLDGNILAQFGETGDGPGQFDVAHSVYVDEKGNVYTTEAGGKRIQKFVPAK